MNPFVYLLIATTLAISVGYVGTRFADCIRKDREEQDQMSVQK